MGLKEKYYFSNTMCGRRERLMNFKETKKGIDTYKIKDNERRLGEESGVERISLMNLKKQIEVTYRQMLLFYLKPVASRCSIQIKI